MTAWRCMLTFRSGDAAAQEQRALAPQASSSRTWKAAILKSQLRHFYTRLRVGRVSRPGILEVLSGDPPRLRRRSDGAPGHH